MEKAKKSRLDSLSEIYNDLHAAADKIIKRYNPCRFSDGQCVRGLNCCLFCDYLSENGCTVKALACKLWLCNFAERKYPKCFRKLTAIRKIAAKHNLIPFFGWEEGRKSKEDVFRILFPQEFILTSSNRLRHHTTQESCYYCHHTEINPEHNTITLVVESISINNQEEACQ